MIAVINNTATPEQIHHFVSWVEEKGLSANVSQGTNETIIGLIGDTSQIDPFLL